MARRRNEMHPLWRRRSIVIPPESRDEWMRLVGWELWMGIVLFFLIAVGTRLIVTAPDRIVLLHDVSQCYAPPPIPVPCERTLYRGLLNVAFSAFSGFMMLAIASWLLWTLWSVAEPAPILDDFLRLLHDSFARDWRNPMTWPWSRVLWAYGFTSVGVALALAVTLAASAAIRSSPSTRAPGVSVGTSETFRVNR